MGEVGRKVVFNKNTNEIILLSIPLTGDVIDGPITSTYPGYDATTMNYISFSYGERENEFQNMASCEIQNGTLVIYPHFSYTIDKQSIQSDGTDTATITITEMPDQVMFTINGSSYPMNPVNNVVKFSFSSTLPGTVIIEMDAGKYGKDQVQVEVL